MIQNGKRRVHILRDDVARKIAAGEVIDRPFSIVRELLDNSLDAGGSDIICMIEEGGLSRIRIIDNGHGMSEEDLRCCFLSHATSKINEEDDLRTLKTLGFRGEALSSIGICALLEITTKIPGGKNAFTLTVREGHLLSLKPSMGSDGTVVDVSRLFEAMPARKQFLKSKSAETSMCRSTVIDKALPFPSVAFRFIVNGKLKAFFPIQDLRSRVIAAYSHMINPSLMHIIETKGDRFKIVIVLGRPELARRDRKLLQLFVNGRRIYDYALLQAVEYGFSSYIPGGSFPVAYVFLTIAPEYVDFNIHPAKKEARIRIGPQIHRSIVDTVLSFLSGYNLSLTGHSPKPLKINEESGGRLKQKAKQKAAEYSAQLTGLEKGSSVREEVSGSDGLSRNIDRSGYPGYTAKAPLSNPKIYTQGKSEPLDSRGYNFKYYGQLFGLFLIVETADSLFLIDQHAAHEKIIYNRLKFGQRKRQELLFPISFDVSQSEKVVIQEKIHDLLELDIVLEKSGDAAFEITSLPTEFLALDEREITNLIKDQNGSLEKIEQELFCSAACRLAIKEGDSIDPLLAHEIVEAVFQLENARCPHGRPVWHRLNRKELYSLVGRS